MHPLNGALPGLYGALPGLYGALPGLNGALPGLGALVVHRYTYELSCFRTSQDIYSPLSIYLERSG